MGNPHTGDRGEKSRLESIHLVLWPSSPLSNFLSQATADFEQIMPETIGMINRLGHDLEILQIYGASSPNNTEMSDDLINIFVDIITFWTQLLHFLRRNYTG